jgi:hypothetical protein
VGIRCAGHATPAKIGTNFADKRLSLGRYSSLADYGHGVLNWVVHFLPVRNVKISLAVQSSKGLIITICNLRFDRRVSDAYTPADRQCCGPGPQQSDQV